MPSVCASGPVYSGTKQWIRLQAPAVDDVLSLLCSFLGADPFQNDETFLVSVLSLEELGATGNKVCASATALHITLTCHVFWPQSL